MLSFMVLFNSLKTSGYRLLLYAMTTQKNSLIIDKKLSIRNASFDKTKVSPRHIRFWIDGKCFNIHPMKKRTRGYDKAEVNVLNDAFDKNDMVFITKDNGMITSSLRLPSYYCKKLKFQMMNDIENIMEETNTNISIPKIGELKILGDNKQQIKKAFQEILSLISDVRNETRPLQFLSIPLCNEEIKKNFMEFKKRVLQENDIKGVDETLFISPLKLHLTVTVMVLMDHGETQEAIKTLQDYQKDVLKPLLEKSGPLKIQVTGIECMNNKYDKVHVLYAKAKIINETVTSNLQNIINGLSDYFYERGLLKQYQENITVHMTLMNTKYREDSKTHQNSRNKHRFTKRIPFDARTIMKKYKDFDFGTCDFSQIHISIMSSVDKTGFYESLATIEA